MYGQWTHVVMLDKLGAAANRQHATKHATLCFGQTNVFALLVLDVDVERVAFQEQLQVGIVLQDGVGRGLVQHALQGSSSRLDKVLVEAADGLLLWGWRHHNSRVVVVQLVVQPKEVAVPAGDGELGVAVCLGGGLGQVNGGAGLAAGTAEGNRSRERKTWRDGQVLPLL